MEKYISNRLANVKGSLIGELFELASITPNVISLGVGEPDFDTPWSIRSEAIHAINQGYTFYTSSLGLIELRKEIANYLRRRFQIEYDPSSQILLTVGASEGIDLVMRALINPGDEVIVVQPSYVAYEPTIILSGGVVKVIEAKEKDDFKLTKQDLVDAITPKTKLLLINYPNNPTGSIMEFGDYAELVEVIKNSGILVLSDEIYAELNYESEHCSLAQFNEIKDQVIVLNGLSKAYAMTGWRLGYLCAHKTLIHYFNRIHEFTIMCPSTITQYAAIEAVKNCDYRCVEMKKSFLQRRNFLVNNLNRMGLTCPVPSGAFYVFFSIEHTGMSSYEFCMALLKAQQVAVVPGNAFGVPGEGYVRISYAYSIDEIKEALRRIELFLLDLEK